MALNLKIEKRTETSAWWTVFVYAMAALVGFCIAGAFIEAIGKNAIEAFTYLFEGSFGDRTAIMDSLTKATPLIFTGLATVIAFRAEIWNIGQEGQVFAGAMVGYLVVLTFPWLPKLPLLILVVACGACGGGALGAVAGVLRNRYGVNEIISTVMFNYIIVYLLSYLLAGGPWTEVGSTISYHQSAELPEHATLPQLASSSKLHFGFIIALFAAVFTYLMMDRTPLGMEIRGLGLNPTTLKYKGVKTTKTIVIILALSGALSALAGVGELFGVNDRLRADYLVNLGFTGIIVGMVGGLRPLGTVIAAIFFGGLSSGALYMKILSGVPASIVPAMEGVLLFCFLCAGVASRFKLVKADQV